MSPILIRPVREQLEHDRIIRMLQAKWKRKYDVQVNAGDERVAPVKVGPMVLFPDLVITSTESPRRLHAVVEVETGESVNNLEAMAQWAHFSKVRASFHLYVPVASLDIARRLCEEHQIVPTELWSYAPLADQLRFALIQKHPAPEPAPVRGEKASTREKPPAAEKRAVRPKAEKTARTATAKAAKATRPARAAASGRRPAAPAKRASKRVARPAARQAGSTAAAKSRPRPARAQKRR